MKMNETYLPCFALALHHQVDSDSVVVLDTVISNEGIEWASKDSVLLDTNDTGAPVDSGGTSSTTNSVVVVEGVDRIGLGNEGTSVWGLDGSDSVSTMKGGSSRETAKSSSSGIVGTIDGAYKLTASLS
jgi:hypothetical protein